MKTGAIAGDDKISAITKWPRPSAGRRTGRDKRSSQAGRGLIADWFLVREGWQPRPRCRGLLSTGRVAGLLPRPDVTRKHHAVNGALIVTAVADRRSAHEFDGEYNFFADLCATLIG